MNDDLNESPILDEAAISPALSSKETPAIAAASETVFFLSLSFLLSSGILLFEAGSLVLEMLLAAEAV
jgi:hypothetical protein